MRASELIKELEQAMKEHGDLEVVYYTYHDFATQANNVSTVYCGGEKEEPFLVMTN